MQVSGAMAQTWLRRLTLVLVALCTSAAAGAAQMELGVMQGVVKDENGQPLADVTFRIVNTERGQEIVVRSDKNGRFYRRGLPAVEYEIRVEKDGYQPIIDRIKLTAGMDRRFDFKLARTAAAGSAEFATGVAAFNAGNFEAAATSFQAAVDKAPTVAELRVNLALAYHRLGRTADAAAQLEQAAALAPDDPRVQYQLGSAYVDMKDLPKAAAAMERGLSKTTNPRDPLALEARVMLGNIHFASGEGDKARDQYEQVLALQPDMPGALLGLGKVHFSQGRTADALRAFERVVTVSPGTPQAAEASAFVAELKK